jgi:vacuolar iron transporter family protein
VPEAEHHKSRRSNWLRAGVLGANDGIVSTASLVLGVAAAQATTTAILTAGLAGLAAGSLSMAVGEYVSVSSQKDVERADLRMERKELLAAPGKEREELARIYMARGLDKELARQVASALMARDALGAHARDELHIDPENLAQPVQAAIVSAISFAVGAAIPLLVMAFSPADFRLWATVAGSLGSLVALAMWSAQLGGAPMGRAALRLLLGGALAMALTAVFGALAGGALPH